MTEFLIIGVLLLVVAALFVAIPLWRGAAHGNEVVRDAANLEILRDQMAELDADLANGLLTPEQHENGKRELQLRLQEEVGDVSAAQTGQRNPLKVLALVLGLLIPAASAGLYWHLGNPDAFNPMMATGGPLDPAKLKALRAQLERSPNNPQGWLVLARASYELENWADAAYAYDKLTQMVPDEAQLWADYADALAMKQGSLRGEPTRLLDRALALDGKQFKALALAGSAAMERGEYPAAVKHWDALYTQLPDKNSEEAKAVADGLSQARDFMVRSGQSMKRDMPGSSRAAQASPSAPAKERITGTVTLDAALKPKVSPEDTVFILARPLDGPPMPLAVVRRQVRDLPLEFSLDDSNAVMPQAHLSGAGKVVVVARISKSGNAMPQSGDLQGMSDPVQPGVKGVKIRIGSVVK